MICMNQKNKKDGALWKQPINEATGNPVSTTKTIAYLFLNFARDF